MADTGPGSDADLRRIAGEAGGVVLVAFQAGSGTRDVSRTYSRHGHRRHPRTVHRRPEEIAAVLAEVELHEVARLARRPQGTHEGDDQAVVIARRRLFPAAPTAH